MDIVTFLKDILIFNHEYTKDLKKEEIKYLAEFGQLDSHSIVVANFNVMCSDNLVLRGLLK